MHYHTGHFSQYFTLLKHEEDKVVKGKNILVIGMARAGIACANALHECGAGVTVTDSKTEVELKESICKLASPKIKLILGEEPQDLKTYDLAVLSPGIPLYSPLIKALERSQIPYIGEIELFYLLSQGKHIGITGTNGKTTTTSLTGHIANQKLSDVRVVGNIGEPAIKESNSSKEDTYFITELSSFQLETIKTYRPHIATLLNLTPDHLNRHKTMENYIQAKADLFKNMRPDDDIVLNADDSICQMLSKKVKGKVHFFSRKTELKEGFYFKNQNVYYAYNGHVECICTLENYQLIGEHNVENALAAIAMSKLLGIENHFIQKGIDSFAGVPHRIELTKTLNGVTFYNDSKATNPECMKSALSTMPQSLVLIAGGLDKGNEFSDVFKTFSHKIKTLVLLGETAPQMKKEAQEEGIQSITCVNTMEEAVEVAYQSARRKNVKIVLLSPGCASWDMYKDFEVRGDLFKQTVNQLQE